MRSDEDLAYRHENRSHDEMREELATVRAQRDRAWAALAWSFPGEDSTFWRLGFSEGFKGKQAPFPSDSVSCRGWVIGQKVAAVLAEAKGEQQ